MQLQTRNSREGRKLKKLKALEIDLNLELMLKFKRNFQIPTLFFSNYFTQLMFNVLLLTAAHYRVVNLMAIMFGTIDM